MVGEAEWEWVTQSVAGDWDHVVLATSLPLLLPSASTPGSVERGRVRRGLGQALRPRRRAAAPGADLEHWAAFGTSFTEFEQLLAGLATGEQGRPPASVTVISGDIHHSYLAAVDFPPGTPRSAPSTRRSARRSTTCSRSVPARPETGQLPAGGLTSTALARLAGVPRPRIRWRITRGPWFRNMLSALEFNGRRARIRFDRPAAATATPGVPRLETLCETELS